MFPEDGAIKRVLGMPGDFVVRDTPKSDVVEGDDGKEVGEGEPERGGEREGRMEEEKEMMMLQVRFVIFSGPVGDGRERGRRLEMDGLVGG